MCTHMCKQNIELAKKLLFNYNFVSKSEFPNFSPLFIYFKAKDAYSWLYTCISHCCFIPKSCPTFCDPMDCSPPLSFCPWDFPGKNTGIGCHFFLQGIFLTRDQTHSSCISRWLFTTEPPGKPMYVINTYLINNWSVYKFSRNFLRTSFLTLSLKEAILFQSTYMIAIKVLCLPNRKWDAMDEWF